MKIFYKNFPQQYGKFLYLKNKIFLFPKIILLKLGILNFFGTKSQDKWVINEIFNHKKNGFFVDLAATNGLLENNTFVLETFFGWSGIAIEPNNQFFFFLKKNRKCKCVNKVVSSKKKKINFFENGPTGGVIGEEFDNNYLKRRKLIIKSKNKIKSKKTATLEEILDDNLAPKVIHYLSLDVEGSETDIMRNFNFKKYKFLSLTIERPTPELNNLLFKNDYLFVKNYKVDSFYVHKSLENIKKIKKEKFSQLPPKSW